MYGRPLQVHKNMSKSHSSDPEIFVTLADFLKICKKGKNKIIFAAVVGLCFALLYSATRPIVYEASATFREKASRNQIGGSSQSMLSSLLLSTGSTTNNSEAISIMRSRTLLEQVVQKEGLQAFLEQKSASNNTLRLIFNNLWLEYAIFKKKIGPIFSEPPVALQMQNVIFKRETPLGLKLKFLTDDTYQISSSHDSLEVIGQLDQPIAYNDIQFTLFRKKSEPLQRKEYSVTFLPLAIIVDDFSRNIKIDTDKSDPGLLKLFYTCSDRHLAANRLNTFMSTYQQFLKDQQQRILGSQMDYLSSRHRVMQNELKDMMNAHADILSSDLVSTGFPDAEKTMEFLASTQQQYAKSILAIDLSIKRLLQMQKDDATYYEDHEKVGGASGINDIMSEIRKMHMQADAIELALRDSTINDPESQLQDQEDLTNQLAELSNIQSIAEDSKQMLADLEIGKLPDSSLPLYHNPQYMIASWCNHLIANYDNPHEKYLCTESFKAYLTNLIRLSQVQESAVQERLAHQHSTDREFQGIDLQTAKELFLRYSTQLHEIETEILQKKHLLSQMQDPTFELTALSTVLDDPFSENLLSEVSELLMSLKDQENRSTREQERLQNELSISRDFLGIHLDQTIQLLHLSETQLKNKLKSLRSVMLGLMQQYISVLEKHLADHINMRIDGLVQERQVLDQHQFGLRQDMAKLPQKWVSQKMINYQTTLNKSMVEEISKLVETRNIANNLEVIQSAPIDVAISPMQPKNPHIIFLSLIGAFCGAFLGGLFVVATSIPKGIKVTAENLLLAKLQTAGQLSREYHHDPARPLSDQDLDVLRRLVTQLTSASSITPQGNIAVLIQGRGPNYSQDLADLMSKQGLKVLRLLLPSEQLNPTDELPGLLQYLNGKASSPKIAHQESSDVIFSGGVSRFANELICAPAFHHLLKQLQTQYQWIFIVSEAPPKSAESECLLNQFQRAVITITNESWQDLQGCFLIAEKKDHSKDSLFFIIA